MRAWFLSALMLTGAAVTAQEFQVSVNVNLVVLQATVQDRGGRFAPDLTEKDFTVYEDGVKQTVTLFRHEDVPVTVGLLVDHSGSMNRKLAEVVAATRVFVETGNPRDQIFVINFNDRVALAAKQDQPFFTSAADLEPAILRTPAIGMTRLYDALEKAQEQLRAGKWDRKVLIAISDGGDNASKRTLSEVLKQAEESPAVIYTIGIFDAEDEDRNPDVLRRLARVTGGEAFFPPHLEGTVEVCRKIAHDIRNQYTLGYVSSNTSRTGAVRAIRVTASAPGSGRLVVRTRSGYVSGEK